MKKAALILLLAIGLSSCIKAIAQEHTGQPSLHTKRMSIGLRLGFNSSMFFIDKFNVGEAAISNIQNNYKVGYFGSFFWRINMKKHHFIQSEIVYNIAKGSISAPRSKEYEDVLADNVLIKSYLHSFNLPILYGYKFIDINPYGMAFFVGPEVSYIWRKYSKSEYSGFYQQQIAENIYPFNAHAVLGLAVNVSNIFFDFRYGIALHNMVKGLQFDSASTTEPYNRQSIVLKRRNNELSFSVGIIF